MMIRGRAPTSVHHSSRSHGKLTKALVTPGMSRLQHQTAQHMHGKQIPQHSRVLLCTAVLSASGAPSSSKALQLRQPSANSRTQLTHSSRFSSMRRSVMPPLAMVNVDFASPSLVLGVTLIGCGIALLQVRNMQREVSRDADIVVAAMISIVGSTLIFQGWRLDPLLLLCQALTTSVAFWYGLEAFKLRGEMVQEEDPNNMQGQQMPPLQDMPPMQQQQQDFSNAARSGYLPPAADRSAPWAQQQPQQQQQQQAGAFGPGSSTRWGLPAAGQQQGVPYDAFAGSSSGRMGAAVPDAAYAGYEQDSQQQYMPPGGGYGSSSSSGIDGYGNVTYDPAAGMYGGQAPTGQQQQQYDWPSGGYQQPPLGAGFMPQQQQQPGWYGPSGVPLGPDGLPLLQQQPPQQQQLPYGGFPGLADPYMPPGGVPASGVGSLPGDGTSLLPGGYGQDGSSMGLPLPPPAADGQQQPQQQQRQRQPGQVQQRAGQSGGRNAYEQVDDWE